MLLGEMRLQNISPFGGLGIVARELDIPLTLMGGTASRAAIRLFMRPRMRLDLFDLAPFSSDIDLDYDAPPERGAEVLASIQQHVPFASWFRWSLIDRERAAKAVAQREVSTIVPLRSIRFSTDRPPDISEQALMDLHTGEVRFWRNPKFDSGSADAAPDAEIFGLMMALNVEVDVRAVERRAPGLDEAAALEWLKSDGWRDLGRILDDDRLRGRFWALFATRWSLGGSRGRVFETLTQMADQVGILERLGFDPADEEAPIGLSKLNRWGQFRAPKLTPKVYAGVEAERAFVAAMNDVIGGMGLRQRITNVEGAIDPALELVAVAPFITIDRLPNESESPGPPDVFESGIDDEFVQVSWVHKGRVGKSGFTAQLLPYAQRRSSASFSSVPAVGGVHGDRAWVRIRLDDLTDPEDERLSTTAALVILQARND